MPHHVITTRKDAKFIYWNGCTFSDARRTARKYRTPAEVKETMARMAKDGLSPKPATFR